jgi:hypothetical protein
MAEKANKKLLERWRKLDSLARSGQLTPAGFEALAEACFRLATTPGQEPAEAVRLLRRAIRLDGTNPKHAYFLARIYFLHGDFDRASRWLREAARHCPSSHRIWSHIAILHSELNTRYRGSDAYEPDDLRLRGTEVLRRVRLGSDSFTADLLDFQPRESTKRQRERRERQSIPAGDETRDEDGSADHENKRRPVEVVLPTVAHRFIDPGVCRWSGAADLALEGILEGAASEITCQKARPLLQQAARLAATRLGGSAAFAILGIEWCVAGFPVETVEHLRRTFPPGLDAPSLRLLDFVCRCFRIPTYEVPKVLSAALSEDKIPATLAAILHHRLLLWQSLEARSFVKHSAGCRWIARHKASDHDLAAKAVEMARLLTQAASVFSPKPRPALTDLTIVTPKASPDWSSELALLEHATAKIGAIAEAAAPLPMHVEGCTDLIRALENAAERAHARLDDLLVAAFEAAPLDHFRPAAARVRRSLNNLLYSKPFASRFLPTDGRDGSSGQATSEIVRWREQADAILPSSGGEAGTAAEQLVELESAARESRARLDRDWKTLTAHFETKKKSELGEKAVAECVAIADCVEELSADSGEKIRQIADLRASGKLRDWSPEEIFDAKRKFLIQQSNGAVHQWTVEQVSAVTNPLPPSEIKRLDETVNAWREISGSQGRFRRVIAQLALPKRSPAKPATAQQADDVKTTQTPRESEQTLTGIPAVERALSQFMTHVQARFIAALDTFAHYTPNQIAEPALAALHWSVRARQAEALFRLGQKAPARRVWSRLLHEDRLSVPLLKNIAVALTGGVETGRELSAWRDYAEMLYFQDCARNSRRPRASARAMFHRDFGSATLPECFHTTKRDGNLTEADETSLVSFLETPARVRAYVTHKRIECFNRKLDFASPTLVLGCEKNEHENTRSRAAEKLLAFADACSSLMPQRVREHFRRQSRQHVDSALQNCKDFRRILADNAYEAERPRQLAWVREIAMLKLQIGDCILGSEELPRRITSPAFLDELVGLDDVPIDLSPNVLSSISRKAETLVNYMAMVRDNFLHRFTDFLNEEGGDEALRRLRERQFARLTNEWLELPSVRGSMPVIQFLIRRLETASTLGQHERACQIAIFVIRADDRRANVTQLALFKFLEAAEAARRCMFHHELAIEINAWIERARQFLDTHTPDADEKDTLTEDAIIKVGDTLPQVLTGTFLAPHSDVKPEERIGRLEKPLDELIREHPIARPCRMVKHWEFVAEAHEGQRRDELLHWARRCKLDVDAVLSDPKTTKKYREMAESIKAQIRNAGI